MIDREIDSPLRPADIQAFNAVVRHTELDQSVQVGDARQISDGIPIRLELLQVLQTFQFCNISFELFASGVVCLRNTESI
jgi:hypothetical protein